MQEWYYTRNGEQQGPVNLGTLRDMAQDGSLKPDDMVWNSSMSDWVPSSEIQGIHTGTTTTPSLASGIPEPPPSSNCWSNDPNIEEIEPGSDPIEVGECIGQGFKLTTVNFLPLLGIIIVYIIISMVANVILTTVDAAIGMGSMESIEIFGQTMNYRDPSFLNQILSNILSIFLNLGLIRIGLNIVDGKDFNLGQLFSGGPHLVWAFLGSLLLGLMMLAVFIPAFVAAAIGAVINPGIGILLLILLGIPSIIVCIYLGLRFGLFMNAIVDRNMGPIESFSYSSRLTTNNRLNLFLLGILGFLIMLAGFLLLCDGIRQTGRRQLTRFSKKSGV